MCVYFPRFALNRGGCSHAHTCKRRPRFARKGERRGRGDEDEEGEGTGRGSSYYNFIIITTFIAYSLLMALYKVILSLRPLRNKFLLNACYLFKLH